MPSMPTASHGSERHFQQASTQGTAALYTYFASTAVMVLLVLKLPPTLRRSGPRVRARSRMTHAATGALRERQLPSRQCDDYRLCLEGAAQRAATELLSALRPVVPS